MDINEVEYIRQSMLPWKENPHQLLQIDISWNHGAESDGESQILLERWRVHYEYNNNTVLEEVTPKLKQVYKKVRGRPPLSRA